MYRNKYGQIKIIEGFNVGIYIYIYIYIYVHIYICVCVCVLFCIMWSDENSLG